MAEPTGAMPAGSAGTSSAPGAGAETGTAQVTENTAVKAESSVDTLFEGASKDVPAGDVGDTDDFDYKHEFEELDQRHKKLLDIHRERTKDIDDVVLNEILEAREMKIRKAPETYDHNKISEVMKENGMEVMDIEGDGKEQWKGLFEFAKERGWDESDISAMIEYGQPYVNQEIARLGPAVDKDAEIAKLNVVWGDQTETKYNNIYAWAKTALSTDVLNKPLTMTAEGMKVLDKIQQHLKGAQPIMSGSNSRPGNSSERVINEQLDTMVRSEAYNNSHHKDHKNIHSAFKKLLEQKLSKKE